MENLIYVSITPLMIRKDTIKPKRDIKISEKNHLWFIERSKKSLEKLAETNTSNL